MRKYRVPDGATAGQMVMRVTPLQADRLLLLFEVAERLGKGPEDALVDAANRWIEEQAKVLGEFERRRWGLHEQKDPR